MVKLHRLALTTTDDGKCEKTSPSERRSADRGFVFRRLSPHLFNQSGNSESAVDLLQAVEIFEGRVQLGHEGALVHAAAVAGVDPRAAQQVVLGRRVHGPEQSGETGGQRDSLTLEQ